MHKEQRRKEKKSEIRRMLRYYFDDFHNCCFLIVRFNCLRSLLQNLVKRNVYKMLLFLKEASITVDFKLTPDARAILVVIWI